MRPLCLPRAAKLARLDLHRLGEQRLVHPLVLAGRLAKVALVDVKCANGAKNW